MSLSSNIYSQESSTTKPEGTRFCVFPKTKVFFPISKSKYKRNKQRVYHIKATLLFVSYRYIGPKSLFLFLKTNQSIVRKKEKADVVRLSKTVLKPPTNVGREVYSF